MQNSKLFKTETTEVYFLSSHNYRFESISINRWSNNRYKIKKSRDYKGDLYIYLQILV